MSIHLEISKRWNGEEASSPVYFLEISFDLETSELIITVDAPFFDDPVPLSKEENNRSKGLWDYEVVELFIASGIFDPDSEFNPYLEIEIGPHGHWYLCSFISEANYDNIYDSFEIDKIPITTIDRINNRWSGSINIPSFLVPEPLCLDDLSSIWMVNAFAAHGVGEAREYLAYSSLPGSKPNFHQLKYFVPIKLQESLLQNNFDDDSEDDSKEEDNEQSDIKGSKKKIQFEFRPSTMDNDVKLNIINKITQKNSTKPVKLKSTLETIEEVKETQEIQPQNIKEIAQIFKDKFAQPDISPQYLKHIFPDEFIVLYGVVLKRKGWSYKQRMLILTSKPRLFYLKTSNSMRYKGSIPWTLTSPITVSKIDENNFDIELFDKSRTYHINDKEGSSRWVEALSSISKSWGSYLKSSVGAKYDIHAVKKAMKEIEDIR